VPQQNEADDINWTEAEAMIKKLVLNVYPTINLTKKE